MKLPVTTTFTKPDEVRRSEKGRFEIIHVGGMTLGRATYEPGWIWSKHVGAALHINLCNVEHVGMVLSGRMLLQMADGAMLELNAGTVFYIPPGHDSWVVGDEPYVSLHVMGAKDYANTLTKGITR